MKTTIVPTSTVQLKEWTDKLREMNVEYKMTTQKGRTAIELEAAFARDILGVEPPKIKREWNVFSVLLVCVSIFTILAIVITPPKIEEPPAEAKTMEEMTMDELREWYNQNMGLSSDWLVSYQLWIKDNFDFVNKNSFRTQDLRIFPIDKDSATIVLQYSVKNAFNARVDHSITSVIGSDGEIKRIVAYK
jgi:hypothetical protein